MFGGVSFKHRFAAFLSCIVLFIGACGPLLGGPSGEKCDPGGYPPRCTDGVLFACVAASDCSHHDCSGWGCECFDYPHIDQRDCSGLGQRCVVDKDRAFCE